MRRRDFLVGGLAAATSGQPLAQGTFQGTSQTTFPTRPIRIVVPSSAGGVHDVIARIWADRVKTSLGTVVVENRGGGGASIALNYVAQSQADGYTLLLGSTSTLVLREGSSNRAYDAIKDIAPATIVATTSTSIAVNPSLPVQDRQGADRLRQGASGQARLRVGRGRRHHPRHGRALQAAGRRPRHAARALQGRRRRRSTIS